MKGEIWKTNFHIFIEKQKPNRTLFLFGFMLGDPDRIRTCDPQIRNLLLYPAELRNRRLFDFFKPGANV